MTRIAIVGAGIAGLIAARQLRQQTSIKVFEKSWRAGGRITSRLKHYEFDHGAQHFYVKTDAFRNFLTPYINQGLVQRWDARFVEIEGSRIVASRQWNEGFPHYVAVPAMSSFGQALADGLDIQYQTRVTRIMPNNDCWRLDGEDESLGDFDWVILAVPAPQAAALLPDCFEFSQQFQQIRMQACYSLMMGFEDSVQLEFDAALVRNSDISWISVNSSKPGRPPPFTLLVHSSNSWADDNLELSRDTVIEHLSSELSRAIDQDLPEVDYVDLHRWLYANIGRQQGDAAWIDRQHRLAAIGDWCISGRVESAFTSALELSINITGK